MPYYNRDPKGDHNFNNHLYELRTIFRLGGTYRGVYIYICIYIYKGAPLRNTVERSSSVHMGNTDLNHMISSQYRSPTL